MFKKKVDVKHSSIQQKDAGAVYRFLKTLTKFVHRVTVRQSPSGYPGIAGDGSGYALRDVPSTNAAPTQPPRQGRRANEYTAFLQI